MIKFIIMLFLLIPIGVYLYFYFLRIAGFWGINRKAKKVKISAAIFSICAVFWSINLFRIGAIIVIHLTAVALMIDILILISRHLFPKNQFSKNSLSIRFFYSGLAPILITSIIFGYGYYNIKNVLETDYTITTQKNIRKQGYRIAMISDLHFGTTMNEKKLKEYCKTVEGKKPDLMVLCGDIIDEKTSFNQMENAINILGDIQTSYGTFFIYGNHDKRMHAANSNYNEKQLSEQLVKSGIHIVEDEIYQVNQEITLIGRKDRGFLGDKNRKTMDELLKDISNSTFRLVLDHQPCELSKNSSLGIDLQLSGHTHGGQLWPIGIMNDLTEFDQLNYGYKKIGKYQIIVSSGIAGWGYPLRTGSHSEYVIVDLKRQ